jgi:hypothetical protein
MRIILALATLGAAAFASGAGHAQSPYSYRWCALNGDRSGATTCYFQTRAQCEATISGIGGSCIRNPSYRGGGSR